MESFSPTIVAIALAAVAFIAWLIRLESKATVTAAKVVELDADLYRHSDNAEIHHRAEDLDRRFESLQTGIDKIEQGISTGFEKINNRIDRLMTSK